MSSKRRSLRLAGLTRFSMRMTKRMYVVGQHGACVSDVTSWEAEAGRLAEFKASLEYTVGPGHNGPPHANKDICFRMFVIRRACFARTYI